MSEIHSVLQIEKIPLEEKIVYGPLYALAIINSQQKKQPIHYRNITFNPSDSLDGCIEQIETFLSVKNIVQSSTGCIPGLIEKIKQHRAESKDPYIGKPIVEELTSILEQERLQPISHYTLILELLIGVNDYVLGRTEKGNDATTDNVVYRKIKDHINRIKPFKTYTSQEFSAACQKYTFSTLYELLERSQMIAVFKSEAAEMVSSLQPVIDFRYQLKTLRRWGSKAAETFEKEVIALCNIAEIPSVFNTESAKSQLVAQSKNKHSDKAAEPQPLQLFKATCSYLRDTLQIFTEILRSKQNHNVDVKTVQESDYPLIYAKTGRALKIPFYGFECSSYKIGEGINTLFTKGEIKEEDMRGFFGLIKLWTPTPSCQEVDLAVREYAASVKTLQETYQQYYNQNRVEVFMGKLNKVLDAAKQEMLIKKGHTYTGDHFVIRSEPYPKKGIATINVPNQQGEKSGELSPQKLLYAYFDPFEKRNVTPENKGVLLYVIYDTCLTYKRTHNGK